MASKHQKRGGGKFVAIPSQVLNSKAYTKLSSYGCKLLLDLSVQYNGNNNGDLSAPFSILKDRGWLSPSTLNKSIKQVIAYNEHWFLPPCLVFCINPYLITCLSGGEKHRGTTLHFLSDFCPHTRARE